MFQWRSPQLFGVPLSLTRTDRRLDWDQPARDLDEWLESVDLWIMEDVDNGFEHSGRRRRVDDYIELRDPGWPWDSRYCPGAIGPGDTESWLRVPFVQRDGLDPDPAVQRREAKTLLAWAMSYENNSTGSPYLAQATVVWVRPEEAEIDHVEIADGVPATLVIDLIREATHAAAGAGATRVITRLSLPHLDILGFRPRGDHLAVATTFLDEDFDAAEAVLRAELANPGLWGRDRDRENRYLPISQVGRLIHRLRHGSSGTRRRTYIG